MMVTYHTSARHGFTLLELSIVLAIIALIAGVGMSMASGALKAADRITTQERLNTIKKALDSFAKTYGYLPCPADRTLLPGSTNYGLESRGSSTSCAPVASGVLIWGFSIHGMLPVRTLGLPDNYGADAWGNKFTYVVAPPMITADPSTYATQQGSLVINSKAGSSTGLLTASAQVTNNFDSVANNGSNLARVHLSSGVALNGTVSINGGVYKGTWSAITIDSSHFDLVGSTFSTTDSGTYKELDPTATGIAYLVISHGPDGRGAFPLNSTSVPFGKYCNTSATANSSPKPCTSSAQMTCIDITNCTDNSYNFYDTTYNDGSIAAQYFDDYVVWGSNEVQKIPFNPTLYTACPTGICEPWCATCSINYPGGGSTAPPATITANPFLYKKIMISNSTTCNATCFWGGTTATGWVKAP